MLQAGEKLMSERKLAFQLEAVEKMFSKEDTGRSRLLARFA